MHGPQSRTANEKREDHASYSYAPQLPWTCLRGKIRQALALSSITHIRKRWMHAEMPMHLGSILRNITSSRTRLHSAYLPNMSISTTCQSFSNKTTTTDPCTLANDAHRLYDRIDSLCQAHSDTAWVKECCPCDVYHDSIYVVFVLLRD